jgi:hypothetical protein
MQVQWNTRRCILCLGSDKPMTVEHIIPESIGGVLTSNFLCKNCNDALGFDLDASAKKDPTVRLASQHLNHQIPHLTCSIEEGQRLVIRDENGINSGFVKDGAARVDSRKAKEGSLILPTDNGRKALRTKLQRQNHDEGTIEEALRRFDSAPDNISIAITPGIDAVKWTIHELKLDLSQNAFMDQALILKIAYEFLALHIGNSIYDNAPQLNRVRDSLRTRTIDDNVCTIERLSRGKYEAMHGITCRSSNPVFVVLVMLFGEIVFRVTFHELGFEGCRFSYTHLLATGQEDLIDLTESKFSHFSE